MSPAWNRESLLQPITPEQPCGEDLENTALFSLLGVMRLFGRATPPDISDPSERQLNWQEIEAHAVEGLARSKDLRLLTFLAAATLRTAGIPEFCETIRVAHQWFESYWDHVYPGVEDGLILRRNTLSCLADPIAIIDHIQRTPLATSRRYGAISLRDIDIVADERLHESTDRYVDGAHIDTVFEEEPVETLTRLRRSVDGAVEALDAIQGHLDRADPEMPPAFPLLQDRLRRLSDVLREQLAARSQVEEPEDEASAQATAAVASSERIATREEALHELDRLAEYVSRTAPGSPVPVLLERARRLMVADYVDVLADMPIDGAGTDRTGQE